MGRLLGEKGAKFLNGTKAGDLPLEDALDYAIVLNLTRTRDLGIEIPPSVLAAANAKYMEDLVFLGPALAL